MKGPRFWRALERIGTTGAARADWRLLLGDEWASGAAWLREEDRVADMVIDPDRPNRHLDVIEEGDDSFVALAEEPPWRDPIPLARADVEVLVPDWRTIGPALGPEIGFVSGDWKGEGQTRQVGIVQARKKEPRPVHLHMPAGTVADRARLLRDLGRLDRCIVLVPSAQWMTPSVVALAKERDIQLEPIAERLEMAAAERGSLIARAASSRPSPKKSRLPAPILDVGPGWTWDNLHIEIDPATGRLIARYGRERGEYRFHKDPRKGFAQDMEILARIAVEGSWRNPPSGEKAHARLRKAFARLGDNLSALIPIPGKPFEKRGRVWGPMFQIRLSERLRQAARGRDFWK